MDQTRLIELSLENLEAALTVQRLRTKSLEARIVVLESLRKRRTYRRHSPPPPERNIPLLTPPSHPLVVYIQVPALPPSPPLTYAPPVTARPTTPKTKTAAPTKAIDLPVAPI